MVREIYLVAKQETGRLVVIGRKGNNNVISEEIVKRETEQLLPDFLYLFYLKTGLHKLWYPGIRDRSHVG